MCIIDTSITLYSRNALSIVKVEALSTDHICLLMSPWKEAVYLRSPRRGTLGESTVPLQQTISSNFRQVNTETHRVCTLCILFPFGRDVASSTLCLRIDRSRCESYVLHPSHWSFVKRTEYSLCIHGDDLITRSVIRWAFQSPKHTVSTFLSLLFWYTCPLSRWVMRSAWWAIDCDCEGAHVYRK